MSPKACDHRGVAGPQDWRPLLRHRLRGAAAPVFHFDDRVIPGASLWVALRTWVSSYRELGLVPGDRLVLAAEPSPGCLAAMLAAIWEGLTLIPVAPRDAQVAATMTAAAAVVADLSSTDDAHFEIGMGPLPVERTTPPRRPTRGPITPDVRFLLRTSGSTGEPKWVALSDANVLSVITVHRARLKLQGRRVLSALPWRHAFGLVIDLLPAMLDAELIYRDPKGGRDIGFMIEACTRLQLDYGCLVPVQARTLWESPEGAALLRSRMGGVVGGAPIDQTLAQALSGTRLRVGYGQTEASPGICLGEPGRFANGWLGSPLGCTARVATDGQLTFCGPNACIGRWDPASRTLIQDERVWRPTGDIVESSAVDGVSGYRFLGRVDDRFKLDNGRIVSPAPIEARLVEKCVRADQAILLESENGRKLEVVMIQRPDAKTVDARCIGEELGPLAERLAAVHHISPEACPRSAKGEIDRAALRERLHSRAAGFENVSRYAA